MAYLRTGSLLPRKFDSENLFTISGSYRTLWQHSLIAVCDARYRSGLLAVLAKFTSRNSAANCVHLRDSFF